MSTLLLALACAAKPHPPTQLPPPLPSADPVPALAPHPASDLDPSIAEIPPHAQRLESGLSYLVLRPGAGGHPGSTDRVTVHYSGWLADGTLVDSSVQRGQSATFPLTAVIPGWTEALQLMQPGETARFWIPESLGYKGRPGTPAGLTVWDIELIAILPQ